MCSTSSSRRRCPRCWRQSRPPARGLAAKRRATGSRRCSRSGPAGEIEGDTPEAVVSRLEGAMARHDYAAATALFAAAAAGDGRGRGHRAGRYRGSCRGGGAGRGPPGEGEPRRDPSCVVDRPQPPDHGGDRVAHEPAGHDDHRAPGLPAAAAARRRGVPPARADRGDDHRLGHRPADRHGAAVPRASAPRRGGRSRASRRWAMATSRSRPATPAGRGCWRARRAPTCRATRRRSCSKRAPILRSAT